MSVRSVRRSTIRDVARLAEVSTVTVSRVCNEPGKVVAATRERVRQAMADLGYVPNLAARTMRTQATRTIGFLLPDLRSYPNAAVAQAAADHLARRDYAILLASSDQQPMREIEALAILRTRQVDGIILYACDQDHPGLRAAVADLDVPCVLLDREMAGPLDRVLTDHAPAMVKAVAHLAGLGHTEIAFVQRAAPIRPTIERKLAFLQAAQDAGIDSAGARTVHPSGSADQIDAVLVDLLTQEDRPTAVIAEGSNLLLASIHALKVAGLSVPDQVALIGIDADDIARAATPEISCIVRDFHAIGEVAAQTMLSRLQNPLAKGTAVNLPCKFIERESLALARRSMAG